MPVQPYTGDIRYFAFDFAPAKWLPCDGQLLPISEYEELFEIISTSFGGDGVSTFALPDLRGRVMMHRGNNQKLCEQGGDSTHVLTFDEMPAHNHLPVASSNIRDASTPEHNFWPTDKVYNKTSNTKLDQSVMDNAGDGLPHDNMAPFLSLMACICFDGIYPPPDFGQEDFIGTVVPIAYDRPLDNLRNWLPCDGQELSTDKYKALFAVTGYKYGGSGATFKLPDLRARAPISQGQGVGLSNYANGDTAGAEKVKLTIPEIGPHTHTVKAKLGGDRPFPNDQDVWANAAGRPGPNGFATEKGQPLNMSPATVSADGGDGAHNNLMPYQTVGYVISHDGYKPS